MFRRRHRLTHAQRLSRYILLSPKGWQRSFRYLGLRIARLPGSAYHIAAGFACGAAVSFTPFFGLHIFLSMLLAGGIGGSIMAALVGTLVGNPVTFPFIWYLTYRSGTFLLRAVGLERLHGNELSYAEMVHTLTLADLMARAYELLLPMAVGGVIWALIVWPLFFAPTRILVQLYQHRRRERVMNGPRLGRFQRRDEKKESETK